MLCLTQSTCWSPLVWYHISSHFPGQSWDRASFLSLLSTLSSDSLAVWVCFLFASFSLLLPTFCPCFQIQCFYLLPTPQRLTWLLHTLCTMDFWDILYSFHFSSWSSAALAFAWQGPWMLSLFFFTQKPEKRHSLECTLVAPPIHVNLLCVKGFHTHTHTQATDINSAE